MMPDDELKRNSPQLPSRQKGSGGGGPEAPVAPKYEGKYEPGRVFYGGKWNKPEWKSTYQKKGNASVKWDDDMLKALRDSHAAGETQPQAANRIGVSLNTLKSKVKELGLEYFSKRKGASLKMYRLTPVEHDPFAESPPELPPPNEMP
jgi:hypothetical protein